MSLVMEDFKPSVSTLEEVKKLQDLVRKLEIQNLHLRNKQISNRRRSDSPVKERRGSPSSPRLHKRSSDEKASYDSHACVENSCFSSRDEYFDDLEIIRVSDIEMSDDESCYLKNLKMPRNYLAERKTPTPNPRDMEQAIEELKTSNPQEKLQRNILCQPQHFTDISKWETN